MIAEAIFYDGTDGENFAQNYKKEAMSWFEELQGGHVIGFPPSLARLTQDLLSPSGPCWNGRNDGGNGGDDDGASAVAREKPRKVYRQGIQDGNSPCCPPHLLLLSLPPRRLLLLVLDLLG
eukprot:747907-Hanusia_phi.AAC.2